MYSKCKSVLKHTFFIVLSNSFIFIDQGKIIANDMSLLMNLQWSLINEDGDGCWRRCFALITRWISDPIILEIIILIIRKEKHEYVKYAETTTVQVSHLYLKNTTNVIKFGLRLYPNNVWWVEELFLFIYSLIFAIPFCEARGSEITHFPFKWW